MHRTISVLFLLILLVASILPAEVVVRLNPDGASPRDVNTVGLDSERARAVPLQSDKVEIPTSFYILPFIKIDPSAADGDFTVMAVRNEASVINTVTVSIFPPDAAVSPIRTLTNALLPREVWSLNLRAEASGLPVSFDGLQRGWARIDSNGGPVSADYFQLDPANDFAAGSRPVDVDASELCDKVSTRFLVGGGFTGGTKIFFLVNLPRGVDPNNDPPSVSGRFYAEDSTFVSDFDIFTDQYSFEMDAAELLEGEVNFGSLELDFGTTGGSAQIEYKANNRFSVSTKAVCLDSLAE